MPIIYAEKGEEVIVKKIGGSDEVRRHLENLGFVPGSIVSVVNSLNGNVIVNIKESRVALNEDLAKRIMV